MQVLGPADLSLEHSGHKNIVLHNQNKDFIWAVQVARVNHISSEFAMVQSRCQVLSTTVIMLVNCIINANITFSVPTITNIQTVLTSQNRKKNTKLC